MVIMGLMATMGHSCWLGELRKVSHGDCVTTIVLRRVSHGDNWVEDHHGTLLLSDTGFDAS